MKVLLDENIPRQVKFNFGKDLEVQTAQELGWSGKKNGELLGLLTFNDFKVLITLDKNLKYQQNLKKFPLTVIVLNAIDSRPQTIQPYIDKVRQYLNHDLKPGLIEINI